MTDDYRAMLEALDKKTGRIHSRADCSLAYQKSMVSPQLLHESDLIVIGYFHGSKAVAEARQRQMQAAADRSAPAALPPAGVVTKSVKPEPPKTLEEFLARFGTRPATYLAVSKMNDVLVDCLKTHKKAMDALEQRVKEQDARILELEAQHAAHLVPR